MRPLSCLLPFLLAAGLYLLIDVPRVAAEPVQPVSPAQPVDPLIERLSERPSQSWRTANPALREGNSALDGDSSGPRVPWRIPHPVSPWMIVNRHAGLAFEGTVLRVERELAPNSKTVPTVKISFRVLHAIRGVHDGQILTIHEWAGLWVARPRYSAGERLILFLYPPSRLGLTSPVSETAGHFVVSRDGAVRFSRPQQAWFAGEQTEGWQWRTAIPVGEFLRQVRQQMGGRP